MHFELVLGWILVFVVMESQDPEDWQLPLSQLLVDPDQPSTLRQHVRDEAEPFESCVQPRTKPGISQFLLPVLQLENKALVIVLESVPSSLRFLRAIKQYFSLRFLRAIKQYLRGALRTMLKNKW